MPSYPMTLRATAAVSLTASQASGRVALDGPSQSTSQGVQQTIQVIVSSAPTITGLHAGTAADVAFIEFGSSTVTATVPNGATPGSHPILPGSVQTFTVQAALLTNVAAITATGGAALLWFSVGYGE